MSDGGWFTRLRRGLTRSSARLTEGITGIFTKRRIDEATLEELEDLLISVDLGTELAARVTDRLRRTRIGQEVGADEIKLALAEQIAIPLQPVALPLIPDPTRRPYSVLVVGVNGSGKTTTIGKLARSFIDQGMTVQLAAGDTFRAAAVEQLRIWAERTGAAITARPHGADAAGLALDALREARAAGRDVLMIDTAGRLQNRADLMAELEKIVRVLKREDPSAPDSVLLVLDATVGQNAHAQVETFRRMVGVTGLVMTKLDGTARGGVLVAIAEQQRLPIHCIGVGEAAEDLRPFDADQFARSLVGLG